MALECVVLVERVVILILDDRGHSQFLIFEESHLNDTKEENADQKQQMQALLLRKCIVSISATLVEFKQCKELLTSILLPLKHPLLFVWRSTAQQPKQLHTRDAPETRTTRMEVFFARGNANAGILPDATMPEARTQNKLAKRNNNSPQAKNSLIVALSLDIA